jgi:hypothetical protein
MKVHSTPNPIPFNLHPQTAEATGYGIQKVIEVNEPPLQRALRIAGAGYFEKEEVEKKMRRIQLQKNWKAGVIPFLLAFFRIQNNRSQVEHMWAVPLRPMTDWVMFDDEIFVIAYWEKATWDSKTELPPVKS